MEIIDEIISIFSEVAAERISHDIQLSTSLAELSLSSLEFVDIIVQAEELFEIEFEDIMLLPEAFPDVQSFVEYIANRRQVPIS